MTEDERKGVWTTESLRIHINAVVHERFEAAKVERETLLNIFDRELKAFKALFDQARESDRQAVGKAETSIEKRLDSVNEFRGQLADQAATLMPRKECETAVAGIRDLLDREMKLLRADIADLREYKSRTSGKIEKGVESSNQNRWAISLSLTILGLIIGVVTTIVFISIRK